MVRIWTDTSMSNMNVPIHTYMYTHIINIYIYTVCIFAFFADHAAVNMVAFQPFEAYGRGTLAGNGKRPIPSLWVADHGTWLEKRKCHRDLLLPCRGSKDYLCKCMSFKQRDTDTITWLSKYWHVDQKTYTSDHWAMHKSLWQNPLLAHDLT